MAGTLFIITAASGTGKTSLVKAAPNVPGAYVAGISHTTANLAQAKLTVHTIILLTPPSFQSLIQASEF